MHHAHAQPASVGATGARPEAIAAVIAACGFISLALFELALAAGAPWGHAAWGGAHAELSTALRLGSAVGVVLWTAAALIVLGRAGFWGHGRRLGTLFRWGTWFLAAVSGFSALANLASQSRFEQLIFAPLGLVLAVLCTVVARGGTAADRRPRERSVRPPGG
jgi:hypothetical protein